MKFPAYPRMKPSGVEWLGNVPEHWEVKRLDFTATVKARLGWKGLTASEYVPEGFIFLATPNIKREGEIDFTNVNYITADRYFESPEIMVQIGDVLLAKDGSTLGTTNIVNHLPAPTTVNSSIAVLRAFPILNSSYFFRWLTSGYIQSLIQSMKDGQGVPHLFQADIRKFPMLLPPPAEQQSIATFLDRETGRLDRLVAKKRELIERLKEKRTALISRTVTRGLPPAAALAAGLPVNPQLKPSGVEWLGEIPEYWELVRLGRRIELQRGVDITKDEQREGTIPVVSSGGVASFHDAAIARGPGVVVGRKGTAGAVYYVEGNYWPHDTTLYVKAFRRNNPRFVYYKLTSMNLASFDTGSANPTLNRNLIHPVYVSWPPLPEQAAIAAYLDQETAKLDALVAKVEDAVERLQEHRTALITAAVTGKIDVRNLE